MYLHYTVSDSIYVCINIYLMLHDITYAFSEEEWRSEEKSQTHLDRNSLLSPLWTVLVVEGGVGIGKEPVLGVLMED